jgi:hypothetical protein
VPPQDWQAQQLDIPSGKFYWLTMVNSLRDLSVAQLKKAATIKERIEQLEKELTGILGTAEPVTLGRAIRRRRKMSAAGRAKISAAAKARWARVRAAKK